MMIVFLLRHGKAARPSTLIHSDHMRPLTNEGRSEMVKIGRALKHLDIQPDMLVSSPLVRSVQTAEIVSEYVDASITLWDELKPESHPSATLKLIHSLHVKSIMLVGHEPHLTDLISHMISTTMLPISLKKGGLACIRMPAKGFASLRYLLTPRQMGKM